MEKMMKGDMRKAGKWHDCHEMDFIGFPCLNLGLPALDQRKSEGPREISVGRSEPIGG